MRRDHTLRPFQARLTTCVATTRLAGLRVSSHHWPTVPTMPTSIWAYIGAVVGSRPRALNSSARMPSTRDATSPMIDLKLVPAVPMGESRTRIRKPSGEVSM